MSVWEGLLGFAFFVVAFIMLCAFIGAFKRERREGAQRSAEEQAKERETMCKSQTNYHE